MKLTDTQQIIYDHTTSEDLRYTSPVTVIRGFAGTGKTHTISEVVKGITAHPNSAVIVAAPTAAALSVVKAKTPEPTHQRSAIRFRTVAQLSSQFMKVLYLTNDSTSTGYNLDTNGLHDLGVFLDSQGIDTDNLASVKYYDGRFESLPVHLSNPEASLSSGRRHSLFFDEDVLRERLTERFGERSPFDPVVRDEHQLISVTECAERMNGALNSTGFATTMPYIMVDEYSMVDEDQSQLLVSAAKSLKVPLIVVGDPGQLPPVNGAPNPLMALPSSTNDIAVFELTEILRSGDNIATLASDIRGGMTIPRLAATNRAHIVERQSTPDETAKAIIDEFPDMMKDSGAVLTFRNNMVDGLNNRLRQLHGLKGRIKVGDRLVCYKNTYNDKRDYFVNGDILTVVQTDFSDVGDVHVAAGNTAPEAINATLKQIRRVADLDTTSDDFDRMLGLINKEIIRPVGVQDRDGKVSYAFAVDPKAKLSKRDRDVFEGLLNKNSDMACPLIWVKFAHALTVHKSQGSEWGNVVYVVQASDMKINSGTNLPYTAITRAKNNIDIVYVVG